MKELNVTKLYCSLLHCNFKQGRTGNKQGNPVILQFVAGFFQLQGKKVMFTGLTLFSSQNFLPCSLFCVL